jgi:hypothetical protein
MPAVLSTALPKTGSWLLPEAIAQIMPPVPLWLQRVAGMSASDHRGVRRKGLPVSCSIVIYWLRPVSACWARARLGIKRARLRNQVRSRVPNCKSLVAQPNWFI